MLNINCIETDKICSSKRISKKQFFVEYFRINSNNTKKTWKGINDLLNRINKKSESVYSLKDYKNHNDYP